jgi:hypothetical protein
MENEVSGPGVCCEIEGVVVQIPHYITSEFVDIRTSFNDKRAVFFHHPGILTSRALLPKVKCRQQYK